MFSLTCRCRIAHGGLRLQSVPAISFRSPYISSSHLPECIPYVGLVVLVVVQLFDGKGRTFARENPKSSANSSAIAELHLTNKKDKRATSSHGWLWFCAGVERCSRGRARLFYVVLGSLHVASIAFHLSCYLLGQGLDLIESAYLVVAKENYIWCEPRCQDVPRIAKSQGMKFDPQVSSTVLGSANLCHSNPN